MCVHYDELAEKAVEIIDRVNNGIPQEKVEYINPEVVLYRSCGCGSQVVVEDWEDEIQKLYKKDKDIRQVIFMTTECQDAYDEDEYLRVIAKYFKDTCAAKGYLCLCEPPDEEEEEPNEGFTDYMILKRVFTAPWGVEVSDERFPKKELLPEHILEEAQVGQYLICLL